MTPSEDAALVELFGVGLLELPEALLDGVEAALDGVLANAEGAETPLLGMVTPAITPAPIANASADVTMIRVCITNPSAHHQV